mmetsp:Transcript_43366/g.104813  ORF Transcript_43366/g.104813 Transcript_43366/m.104813 type:complete len:401 (+) Transcript_43366:167-1369(+)|eukprot:CAMPEP_0113609942 /NCGR_PEP_ID=MMETSP0017_2-20120614/4758_1 /TAXON_ID=2856 /ORGANISM="Cylindrotheca closterium" /LENGTH=400 /DNA_ID=CAMNT_0000518789 /DNA_START=104 /DNA_END=1306 /DNA_ORIENTATION=+ /assembly_acc=CAM_ASM_000147
MVTAPLPNPTNLTATATANATGKSTTKSPSKTATKAGGGTKTKKTTKKRTTKKNASNSAATQAALNASRAAHAELAAQRNKAAARRSDPLWYRDEDVLPSAAEETAMAEHGKILPEQFQIVDTALLKNNLTRSDVTPQAFNCLLEQARRFAYEVITDSQDYAFMANRTEIAKADLELADSYRPDHPTALRAQLPKLNLLAQTVNRVPLPPIPTQCYSGVLLPPKKHQLTARTFDVVSGAQVANKMVQPTPSLPVKKASSSSSSKSKTASYGANRGRQIAVNIQQKDNNNNNSKGSPAAGSANPANNGTANAAGAAPGTMPPNPGTSTTTAGAPPFANSASGLAPLATPPGALGAAPGMPQQVVQPMGQPPQQPQQAPPPMGGMPGRAPNPMNPGNQPGLL